MRKRRPAGPALAEGQQNVTTRLDTTPRARKRLLARRNDEAFWLRLEARYHIDALLAALARLAAHTPRRAA
jgi:hypothetical protein